MSRVRVALFRYCRKLQTQRGVWSALDMWGSVWSVGDEPVRSGGAWLSMGKAAGGPGPRGSGRGCEWFWPQGSGRGCERCHSTDSSTRSTPSAAVVAACHPGLIPSYLILPGHPPQIPIGNTPLPPKAWAAPTSLPASSVARLDSLDCRSFCLAFIPLPMGFRFGFPTPLRAPARLRHTTSCACATPRTGNLRRASPAPAHALANARPAPPCTSPRAGRCASGPRLRQPMPRPMCVTPPPPSLASPRTGQ
eukprot:346289-Chlamydomonas_euryale.AAC.2